MGLTTPSNNFIWGLSKQTNEGTVATTEEYGMPVYSGRSQPVQTTAEHEVTDAASIRGDTYKQGDEHWEANVLVPAFAAPLPRILTGLYPTDTKTGAGPYTHTMSGLGTAAPWFTTYNTDLLGGSVEETFEAGQCSRLEFSASEVGGPVRVGVGFVGKKPTIASYTNATAQVMGTDGYYTAAGGTLKYEVDSGTPVTETNIRSFAVTIERAVAPEATADSVSVGFLSIGKVDPNLTMTLLMDDHEAYRATFYGAVAGSTPSATLVNGSVELNFVHSVNGAWSAKLTIDKVILLADPPQPDPAGGPLLVTINGRIQKPAAGDHVKPVVINAVSTTY